MSVSTMPPGTPGQPATATSPESIPARHVDASRCVHCHAPLAWSPSAIACTRCGRSFPRIDGIPFLLDDEDGAAAQEAAGHMEALFRFPALYQAKIDLLAKLNVTDDLELSQYLRGRDVIDVGCGPFTYGYDTTLPRSIVGMDLSPQFVRAIRSRAPSNLYLVANARKIPFADRSFDTSFLRFVIHHIPGDTAQLLREVARVTRGHLIIFDHIRSDVPWKEAIQTAYWNTFDSGHHYNTLAEWDVLLKPYKVLAFRQTGKMFGNVCQIVIDLGGEDS